MWCRERVTVDPKLALHSSRSSLPLSSPVLEQITCCCLVLHYAAVSSESHAFYLSSSLLLTHFWRECKPIQSLRKSVWQVLRKMGINRCTSRFCYASLGHTTKTRLILPQRHLLNYVHCCSIHNSQKCGTT